jgi:hypothetical protein
MGDGMGWDGDGCESDEIFRVNGRWKQREVRELLVGAAKQRREVCSEGAQRSAV